MDQLEIVVLIAGIGFTALMGWIIGRMIYDEWYSITKWFRPRK